MPGTIQSGRNRVPDHEVLLGCDGAAVPTNAGANPSLADARRMNANPDYGEFRLPIETRRDDDR